MPALVVVATIQAKQGHVQALRATLLSLIAPTRAEDGCIRYEMNESDSGASWIFTEQWASKAHLERHLASKHMACFKEALDTMVERFDLFTGFQVQPVA